MWDDGGTERQSCERAGVCGVGCSSVVVKSDKEVNPPQPMEII